MADTQIINDNEWRNSKVQLKREKEIFTAQQFRINSQPEYELYLCQLPVNVL